MPAFFIHGVPATHRLWGGVIEHIPRTDIVVIDLPGFGSPLPDGFDASKESYVDWLIRRIEDVGAPVDIVGHDWGGIFAMRIAAIRPDLVRTWVAGGGPINASYQWHPLAKVFQMPGEGEAYFASDYKENLIRRMMQDGVAGDLARSTVSQVDTLMASCILRLYRSAIHVGREWQSSLSNVRAPGLVVWGMDDKSCPIENAEILASDAGARKVHRFNCGHWFPLLRPVELACAIVEHWSQVVSVS